MSLGISTKLSHTNQIGGPHRRDNGPERNFRKNALRTVQYKRYVCSTVQYSPKQCCAHHQKWIGLQWLNWIPFFHFSERLPAPLQATLHVCDRILVYHDPITCTKFQRKIPVGWRDDIGHSLGGALLTRRCLVWWWEPNMVKFVFVFSERLPGNSRCQ
jgi:hypothetical protein